MNVSFPYRRFRSRRKEIDLTVTVFVSADDAVREFFKTLMISSTPLMHYTADAVEVAHRSE